MKQVEASAPTREEAIQKALDQLGAEMYEVDIKILDEGSKGLFGFGVRPVRVEVRIEGYEEQEAPAKPKRERKPRRDDRGEDRKPKNENRERRDSGDGDGEKKDSGGRRKRGQRGRRSGRGRGGAGAEAGASGNGEDRRPQKREERAPRAQREERPKREQAPREPRDEKSGAEADKEAFAAVTDEQGKQAASLLSEIIQGMAIEAKVEFVRSEDGLARLDVQSEDGALLIGRKGSTLNALQYLVNRMLPAEEGESLERIVVDVEGYLDRRREALEEMAQSMAEKAKRSGRNMKLKPMSPQERRIIHLALQDHPDIRTFSQGEALFRSVVISARGEGTDENKPRSSRGGRGRGGRRRGGGGGGGRRQESEIDVGAFGD